MKRYFCQQIPELTTYISKSNLHWSLKVLTRLTFGQKSFSMVCIAETLKTGILEYFKICFLVNFDSQAWVSWNAYDTLIQNDFCQLNNVSVFNEDSQVISKSFHQIFVCLNFWD